MPLASKETLALDSHRPLTYETQQLKATDYSIKTPNMEDFLTKDSGGGHHLDEREDRIRTI